VTQAEGDMPTTVLFSFRIADWDFWIAGYRKAIEMTPGLRAHRVWRGQDDGRFVFIAETFDSREVAESVLFSEVTRNAMKADGIDMSTLRIHYLDEVMAG